MQNRFFLAQPGQEISESVEDTLVFLRGNAFPPDVGCRLRILAFLSGSRAPFR